nr:uncharacterized protein LOC116777932 [Danaus plexippus plexippus]
MTYGSETWSFTKGLMNRLRVAQRALHGVSLRDRIRIVVGKPYSPENRWPLGPKSARMETTDRKAQRRTSSNEMDGRLSQGSGSSAGHFRPNYLEVDEGGLPGPAVDLAGWLAG